MAQHDYLIADQSGLSFLSDLNQLTAAIVSNNSGGVEPTDLYAYMWWADTTSGLLKRRNAANNAWIDFASLSTGLIIGTNVQAYDATTVLEADLIASNITNTPAGNITSTNQQAVNNELDAMMYRKNYIINGAMQIAQLGNYIFTASDIQYGGCDRFVTGISASTVSAIALQTASFGLSGYSHQVGNVTTTGATNLAVLQRIEAGNSVFLNGKTVTVNAKVYQSSGASRNVQIVLRKAGAKDDFSAPVLIAASSAIAVPDNALTPISFTYTLSASDASNGLTVEIYYGGLPALSNAQFYFTDFQLEKGSVATDFEYRPIGEELALCQRYARPLSLVDITGSAGTTTQIWMSASFPPMRTAPTAILPSTSAITNDLVGTITGTAAPAVSGVTATSIGIGIFSGLTSAMVQGANYRWTGATIFLSAEL